MPSTSIPLQTVALAILMVTLTSIGNVLIKMGSSAPASEKFFFGILSWKAAIGIAVFGASVLLYAKLLERLPLYTAQAFAALQFVAVILASFFFLREPITPIGWLGIVFIGAGITLVAVATS